MSKLTLEALKQRADAIVTEELLGRISGGTENACHDAATTVEEEILKGMEQPCDNI